MKRINLTGLKFGNVIVLKESKPLREQNGRRRLTWLCLCDCGKQFVAVSTNLRTGNTQSCGCGRVAACKARATHGMTGSLEHGCWKGMRQRCNNPKFKGYKNYGGRGIRICKRWDSFSNFLADMGPIPGKGFTIERRNVNGDYEPSNCYWLHKTQQNQNRRDSIRLSLGGETRSLAQWKDHLNLNVSYSALRTRYYRGSPPERILADKDLRGS